MLPAVIGATKCIDSKDDAAVAGRINQWRLAWTCRGMCELYRGRGPM